MADVLNMLEEREQEAPIAVYTRCVALADFEGQYPHDLSFKKGETITVLEPCNVIYWYLGENAAGKRGVVPINFLQVMGQRPLPPSALPPKPGRGSPLAEPALPPKPAVTPALPKRPPLQQVPRKTPSPVAPWSSNTLPSRPRPPAPLPPPPLLPSPAKAGSDPHLSPSSPLPAAHFIDTRPPMPVPRNAEKLSRSCETLHRQGAASSDVTTAGSPPPAKPSKYPTAAEFRESSGWFKPTLDKVLMDKLHLSMPAFTQLTCGTYFFQHKWEAGLRYASGSTNLRMELVQLFQNLYKKPLEELNPLETVIRCHHPDALVWNIRTWRVGGAEELGAEVARMVVNHQCLHPCGLNPFVKFSSQKEWEVFCEQYSKQRNGS